VKPGQDQKPAEPSHDRPAEGREAYEPPVIRHVEIAIQEAIMSICKGGTSAGPFGPGCGCRGGGS